MNYERYSTIVTEAAYAVLKTTLETKLAALLPFLFAPPFNKVTQLLVGKLARFIVDESEMRIFFAYTDLRVNKEGRKFFEAAKNNVNVRNGDYDEELKKLTEKKLIDSARTFIKLRQSS